MTENKSRKSADAGSMPSELAEKLRRHILTQCKPGQRLETETAMARRYGCSVTTVRKALAILATEKIVTRRQGSGTYAGDHLPQVTGATGFMFRGTGASLMNQIYTLLSFQGVLEAASDARRHVQVIFAHLRKPFAVSLEVADRIQLGHVDSMICLDVFDQSFLLELGRRMVTVSLDVISHVPGVSSCALDHRQTVEMAVEHLWRSGHRRIEMLGDLPDRDQDLAKPARRGAFLAALRARGLPVSEDSVVDLFRPGPPAEQALAWARRWQARVPSRRPTAVINESGYWCLLHALLLAEIAVPEQISVVNIGNPEPWRHFRVAPLDYPRGYKPDGEQAVGELAIDPLDPRLAPLRLIEPTAVVLPFVEMGHWAIGEVLRRAGRPDLEPEHKSFGGWMKPGNTVAPPTH